MFLAPCLIGGLFTLLFAFDVRDRRLDTGTVPARSLGEVLSTFYVDPRKNPDFAWVLTSRFLFVLAYAFLVTFLAYFPIAELNSPEDEVPGLILLGTLGAIRCGGGGRLHPRREAFGPLPSAEDLCSHGCPRVQGGFVRDGARR